MLVAILQGSGASSYTPVQEFLEDMTIAKIGYLPTLQQQERLGKTSLCTYTSQVDEVDLSHVTPEMPCLVAVRMTSSLPFFLINSVKNGYYTDGGICNNFIDIEPTWAIGSWD